VRKNIKDEKVLALVEKSLQGLQEEDFALFAGANADFQKLFDRAINNAVLFAKNADAYLLSGEKTAAFKDKASKFYATYIETFGSLG